MGLIATVAVVFTVFLFSKYLYHIYSNVRKARQIGVPIVVIPIDSQQLLWLLFSPRFQHLFESVLPTAIWQRLSLTFFGWEFQQKLDPFDRIVGTNDGSRSQSFVLVSAKKLELWTADPILARDMLVRTRDFRVPESLSYALGQYGHNVMTTNGDLWAKHRRIISSVLDERLSKTTFAEAVDQTASLFQEDLSLEPHPKEHSNTLDLFDKLKKISVHVLMRAGLGVRASSKHSKEQSSEEQELIATQIESLVTATTNVTSIGIVPTAILLQWPPWLPGYQRCIEAGNAKVQVQRQNKTLLEQEREYLSDAQTNSDRPPNIVSKLLQASAEYKNSDQGLSDDEMISNLWVFSAAGFETTATTMAYAVVLLARFPHWQDWILEEIDELLVSFPDIASISAGYSALFPRATRIMALMLETLRLYSAVPHIHRETINTQTAQTQQGQITIPADTRVYIDSVALHVLPVWNDVNKSSDPALGHESEPHINGPDTMVFRPSRWVNATDTTRSLYLPAKGTFMPWSMGPRVCPGQKMAQVEFVAAMLVMLQGHRIEAMPLAGETSDDARRRLDAQLSDSKWVAVLQMRGIFGDKSRGELRHGIEFHRRSPCTSSNATLES